MTDLGYLLEAILLLAVPFVPIAVGVLLRRKFSPPPPDEGAQAAAPTGAQKAGRVIGAILIGVGAASILFMLIVLLNFKGYI